MPSSPHFFVIRLCRRGHLYVEPLLYCFPPSWRVTRRILPVYAGLDRRLWALRRM